jgi:hypothetical protein
LKKLHLLNIGFPKTGTTWLFKEISKQKWFDQKDIEKEKFIIEKTKKIDDYISLYNSYNYSANFNTNSYRLGIYYIRLLKNIKNCKVSLIIRNPYECYWSYYQEHTVKLNSHSQIQKKDFFTWTKDMLNIKADSSWSKIIDRWVQVFPNLKIFYYDDLKENPTKFYYEYSKKMNLPKSKNINTTPENVTKTSLNNEQKQLFIKEFKDKIENNLKDLKKNKHIQNNIIEKWLNIDSL